MYDEYDAYLDELLEEAYLEGYYDSIDDYNDYYNESRAIGREWLRLDDNANAAHAVSTDHDLPKSIRMAYQKSEDYWRHERNNLYNQGSNNDTLSRGLRGLKGIYSRNPDSVEHWEAQRFKDKMGRKTYKERKPGMILAMQNVKRQYNG